MGKWLSLLVVGGTIAIAASVMNRRKGLNMNWKAWWSQAQMMLGNKTVRRAMKRGRRLIRSWT